MRCTHGLFAPPASSPTALIGSGSGDLLYATIRAYDLGWPVGVNHHHAVLIQQRPALAASKLVEKPNALVPLAAMSRQSPCIARALPCPYDLHTPAGADFFVAAITSFREHDCPVMRSRAGEDRHFKTTITVSPLHMPVAGSLAVLKQECWFSLWFVHHDELTPPPAAPQLGIDEARRSGRLGGREWYGLRCGRLQLVEDRP